MFEFQTNSSITKQQPTFCLSVQKLKEEALLVLRQLKWKELGQPGQKRKKTYVIQDERIKTIMEEKDKLNYL